MTLDDGLLFLIGSGMALSALNLFYQLRLQTRARKSAARQEKEPKLSNRRGLERD
jgi:hypothetical protein